jgi:hypothetical protein
MAPGTWNLVDYMIIKLTKKIIELICNLCKLDRYLDFPHGKHVKQLFGKKDVFRHPILQAICFKKPVESLNSCQTIVRQKRFILSYYCTGIEQTI